MRRRGRVDSRAATWISAALLALASGGFAWGGDQPLQGALGPLSLRAHSPATILRLSPTPELALLAPPKSFRVAELVSWTNYFDYDPERFVVDAEAVRVATRLAYGVSPRLEVGVELPFSYRWGGVLDRTIEGFHRFFSLSNGQRESQPRNQYRVWVRGREGRPDFELRHGRSGWGGEDPILHGRVCLVGCLGEGVAVVAGAMFKPPLQRTHTLYSTGGHDFGFTLSAATATPRLAVHGMVAGMRYHERVPLPIQLNRVQYSLFTAVEYRLSPRTSWLLQGLATSPTAKGYGDFGQWSFEAALGLKRRVGGHWCVEVGLLENLLFYDNSPDVGLHLGVTWRQ